MSVTVPTTLPTTPSVTSALVFHWLRSSAKEDKGTSSASTRNESFRAMRYLLALDDAARVPSHLVTRDEPRFHQAVVAHEDESGQEILDRAGAVAAYRNERRGVEVEHEEVGRFAGLDAAALAFQRQRARAAERGQVPEVKRTERHALHLLDLVGVGHGREHRRRRAGADVSAEADADAGVERVVETKEPAAEEEIRVWAVGDARFAPGQQIELFLGEPDAVREHGALAEEAVAVVDVGVLGLREELLDPRHLVRVLGDVRVHVGV